MSNRTELLIKSPGLKKAKSLLSDFAMVMWICCKCDLIVWVHETVGENYEPKCPQCTGHLQWNKVYQADSLGNITE